MSYKSTTSMLDLFLLVAIGFVALFVLAFILIKPEIPKNEDIEVTEDLIITLEWDDGKNIDLDLWMEAPNDVIVSFKSKSKAAITLERDDRGYNEEAVFVNGEVVIVNTNVEVMRAKTLVDGDYYLAVQYYSDKGCRKCETYEPFTLTIYDAMRHRTISVDTGRVLKFAETGVAKLTVENGYIINVEKSKRLIATPDAQRRVGNNPIPTYNWDAPSTSISERRGR